MRCAYQEGMWRCNICFEEMPGTLFLHAACCAHFFCAECLAGHCHAQLQESRLDMLLCPDADCKEALLRHVSASLGWGHPHISNLQCASQFHPKGAENCISSFQALLFACLSSLLFACLTSDLTSMHVAEAF